MLDQLTALFWEKGYSQTSVADLVEATGVHKSSLYGTFGAKDELFATILRRYFEHRIVDFAALVEAAGTGVDRIHTFLEFIRAESLSDAGQRGCLLLNTTIELSGSTPGFETFAHDYQTAMHNVLVDLVAQAERDTTPDDSLAQQRADVLLMFLFGFISTVRGGADDAVASRLIDSMHATVDTWHV